MKILDVRFYPCSGQVVEGKRRPVSFSTQITTEDFPSIPEEAPYRAVSVGGRRALYFREVEGVADFFLHDPGDQAGYGGAVFEGVLESGEPFKVKGPWSSSCQTVNALGLPSAALAPVYVTDAGQKHPYRAMVVLPILRAIEEVVRENWALRLPSETPAAPYSSSAADEQNRVIDGSTIPEFQPTRPFEDCHGCEGRGYNPGKPCSTCSGSGLLERWPRCWKCAGRGFETVACAVCGRRFCGSGVAPYPRLILANHF